MQIADLGGGLKINYKVKGQGFPLILIMGFGASMDLWGDDFIAALAQDYQVICFDNRGVGGSLAPSAPPSINLYARDTLALMDHLGMKQAHVVGISMGGMIAQHMALLAPARIAKLVLGATTASAQLVRRNPAIVGLIFFKYAPRLAMRAFVSDAFIKAHHAEIDRLIDTARRYPASWDVTRAHMAAVKTHNVLDQLDNITAPTLVIVRTDDKIINFENSYILAQRIPGAKLLEFPGVGHVFPMERQQETVTAIREFLSEQPAAR